ncbi:hypothetical protein AGLY_001322 [Aphis glycines]|uniref:Uncharacterized protein n=1 Tax=Aphis glycines TaxID=307491 RepID=A0A6G0UAX7_APHGL|nr:hypothetical protein AGLY_001322 [Aphis glycines]
MTAHHHGRQYRKHFTCCEHDSDLRLTNSSSGATFGEVGNRSLGDNWQNNTIYNSHSIVEVRVLYATITYLSECSNINDRKNVASDNDEEEPDKKPPSTKQMVESLQIYFNFFFGSFALSTHSVNRLKWLSPKITDIIESVLLFFIVHEFDLGTHVVYSGCNLKYTNNNKHISNSIMAKLYVDKKINILLVIDELFTIYTCGLTIQWRKTVKSRPLI